MKKYFVILLLVVFGTSAFCGTSKSFSTSGHQEHVKKTHKKSAKTIKSKKNKYKKIKPKVVLKPFSGSFPYQNLSERFSNVTENRACIYTYIQTLNPLVSTTDAFLIASELAFQGEAQEIDPRFVAAVIAVESRFNRHASHSGARGLGQLMGSTARVLGVEDPYNITQNVTATTRYVKQNVSLFPKSPYQGQLALACYLLGPRGVREGKGFSGRVHRYVANVQTHYEALLNLNSMF